MLQFSSRAVLLGAVAVLAAVAAPAPANAHGTPPLPRGDQLVITVRNAGRADGTYVLRCHPSHGTHPSPAAACAALDRRTVWGRDPFAPVPPRALCTMQYGGPATARVSGTWAGRPVDARYDRRDGCQVARWDNLVPLLPVVRARDEHRPATAGAGVRPS
ncbi:SSI family serine proteinase inhibitor [Streptomyces gibsoniae]|uniref:SSI family serine proteinase inhibitor n=1 Tax=Streptomyces gibsoniae TaxID=3075529 RepID=A0ABU2TU77_9ACTN|nr:SSI family serine proteinase inhibitor [Streptomyces sp. DSM 41699]MDT0464518.1 SSI family serine proteinase inhibitor [Streptomyces sp. DSM 41699]